MKSAFPIVLGILCAWSLLPHAALAANEVANQDDLRRRLGLQAYSVGEEISRLKIAILDNGFAGYEAGKDLLPKSAELVKGPLEIPSTTPHGLGMAEILWAMTGRNPSGPKFYLVDANGFTNFKAAIDFVIAHQVDIVLYSQVWSFGSNFDGRGFINAQVNRATEAGILWINAAGNFGGMTYSGNVTNLPDSIDFTNRIDENDVTITLSWNDFGDREDVCSSKDLDLYVYDDSGNLVGSSELRQQGRAPEPGSGDHSNLTCYPRETIALHGLDRGKYAIRIRVHSDNFSDSDLFRIVVETEKPGSVELPGHSAGGEIMAPADNPNVITVGEATAISSLGPSADGRPKPDVTIEDSTVSFTNGNTVRGSSTAAALFAGAVAVLKSQAPGVGFSSLTRYLHRLPGSNATMGLSPVNPQAINPWIWTIAPAGSRVMLHPNGHWVVLTTEDPVEVPVFKRVGAYRQNPDDILVISPVNTHWYAVPKRLEGTIQAPTIEFRRMSAGTPIWQTPLPATLFSSFP